MIRLQMPHPYWTGPRPGGYPLLDRANRPTPWRKGMDTFRVPLAPWLYASGKTPDSREDPLLAYIMYGKLPRSAEDRARFRGIVDLSAHWGDEEARVAGRALGEALRNHELRERLRPPTAHGGLGGRWASL